MKLRSENEYTIYYLLFLFVIVQKPILLPILNNENLFNNLKNKKMIDGDLFHNHQQQRVVCMQENNGNACVVLC